MTSQSILKSISGITPRGQASPTPERRATPPEPRLEVELLEDRTAPRCILIYKDAASPKLGG
jgi:hypothetical protein